MKKDNEEITLKMVELFASYGLTNLESLRTVQYFLIKFFLMSNFTIDRIENELAYVLEHHEKNQQEKGDV